MQSRREERPVIEETHNGLSIDLKLTAGRNSDGPQENFDPESGTMESSGDPSPRTEQEIAEMLRQFLGHRSFRQVAADTGFHAESVRRYLRGKTRIPADFVASVCSVYNIDAMTLLVKDAKGPYRTNPRPKPEDRLAESLVEWLRPQMERWMKTNIVPHWVFLRSLAAEPDEPVRNGERPTQ